MFERYGDDRFVEGRRQRVGPFDERDGVGSDLERKPELLVVGAVQTVCVEVRDCDAPLIALRNRERRAGDMIGHPERAGGAAHERGFASAKFAAQCHHVAGPHE